MLIKEGLGLFLSLPGREGLRQNLNLNKSRTVFSSLKTLSLKGERYKDFPPRKACPGKPLALNRTNG